MTELKPLARVMLVDDGEVDLLVYKRIINRTGLAESVIGCESAEAALEQLRAPGGTPVDVIFLDINMPRMSGFDFLDAASVEFGDAFADMVVVMLTTSLSPRDRDKAGQYDVVKRYINKPLTEELFSEIVATLQGH